jgi:hypothetical protein
LIAVSGAANAGIDSPDMYVVLQYDGFPTSIEDLLQEQYQVGHRPALLTNAADCDHIDISLKSYISLVKWIHRKPSKDEVRGPADACTSAKEYPKHQMQNLDKVLNLLVLLHTDAFIASWSMLHLILLSLQGMPYLANETKLVASVYARRGCLNPYPVVESWGACWCVSETGWHQFILGRGWVENLIFSCVCLYTYYICIFIQICHIHMKSNTSKNIGNFTRRGHYSKFCGYFWVFWVWDSF